MSKKRSTVKHSPADQTSPTTPAGGARMFWLALGLAVVAASGVGIHYATRGKAAPAPVAQAPEPPPPPPAEEPDIEPSPAPGPAPEGMVWVPGGTFWMGYDASPDQDAPVHRVAVNGFWMDRTEVTNAQFAAFVKATGYKTVAERTPTKEQYPDAPLEKLVAGSAVFKTCPGEAQPGNRPDWWEYRQGADWRHPEGPGSTIEGRDNYPVVQIAWEDAAAYAKWAGKRLPTEAEWEFAARGGQDRQEFCWGDTRPGTDGKYFANTFQGKFPETDSGADGFAGLSPAGKFPPNGYGLFDMSGNAWEWCADWYGRDYYLNSPKRNPKGPAAGDPEENGQPQRVRRGGSFLCADSYCRRYLPGTRDKNPTDSSANHTGFRCVRSGPQ